LELVELKADAVGVRLQEGLEGMILDQVDGERANRIMTDRAPGSGDAISTLDDQLDIEELAHVAEAGRERIGRPLAAFHENLGTPFDGERSQVPLRQRACIFVTVWTGHLQMPKRPRIAMAGTIAPFCRRDQEIRDIVEAAHGTVAVEHSLDP